jgi:hypothetical protein
MTLSIGPTPRRRNTAGIPDVTATPMTSTPYGQVFIAGPGNFGRLSVSKMIVEKQLLVIS